MKNLIIYFSIILLFSSCYSVKNGKVTPWIDCYELKNKNKILPERLDTNNLYKLKKRYIYGELVYSDTIKFNEYNNSNLQEIENINIYFKFFREGRCLRIINKKIDFYGNKISLKEEDLNPENSYNSHNYYYFVDSAYFKIETFTKGDGGGAYVLRDYQLSSDGKKIFHRSKITYEEYELIKIPEDWKRYDYYW